MFSKSSKVMSVQHLNMSSIKCEMGEIKISYHPSCDKVPHPGPYSSYFHETFISDAHIVCNDICSVETNTQEIVQTQRAIQSKLPGSAPCKETFPLSVSFPASFFHMHFQTGEARKGSEVCGSVPFRLERLTMPIMMCIPF